MPERQLASACASELAWESEAVGVRQLESRWEQEEMGRVSMLAPA